MNDKFRAWDKKRNEWYGESDPEVLTFYGFAIFGECTLLCTPRAEDLQHLEITQYTGLKDKNGKEIYEGDILRYLEDGFQDDGHIGAVEYCVIGDCKYPAFDVNPRIDSDSNGLSYIMACCYCEVIGKIYENEELLTVNTFERGEL